MKNIKPLIQIPRGITQYLVSKQMQRQYHQHEPEQRKVDIHHTKTFHIKKKVINKTILGTIGNEEIIYGEQSLKARFPPFLQRPTQDYDVYSPKPYKDARQTEKALDHRFGGDYFYVKKATHEGTFKVVAYANQEGYTDYTKKPDNIKYDKIRGKNYISLEQEKQSRLRSLKNEESEWRHAKDRDALNRIKIYENMHKIKEKQ